MCGSPRFPGLRASTDLQDVLKWDLCLIRVPSDRWAAQVCWQSVETSLQALGYLSPFGLASRKMMQGGKEGIGLLPLFVSPGACLHVVYLRVFFSFCLLRRCLVSIV